MEFLQPLVREKRVSFYRLENEYTPEVEKYVVSTPDSRLILSSPEVLGCEFTRRLKSAVTAVIKHFPEKVALARLDPASVSVVNFLRSGLNFGIREALCDALGFNTSCSSFITSQRARDQHGRWFIKDDQYRKIELPEQSNLFIGEVVATGVTVDNGLDIIYHQAKNLGHPLKNIFFFSIGCHKIEKILQKYDRLIRQGFPGYQKTCLFYLEGKFHLADSKTNVRIKLQGTDLLRYPALLAPEYELEQFKNSFYPLERCVIYDAGSRAFHPSEFLEDVTSYWNELLHLAQNGLTLGEVLSERWPALDYRLPWAEFRAGKLQTWKGLDEGWLRRLYRVGSRMGEGAFQRRVSSPHALVELCERRLRRLRRLYDQS